MSQFSFIKSVISIFKMEVVYRGEKFYSQFEKKVKILIVNHEAFSCIEVIVLGVRLGNKAARLYLNSCVMVHIINGKNLKSTFCERLKNETKNNQPFISGFEMKKIALNMITTMLVDGLAIVPSIFVTEFDLCFDLNASKENNDIEHAVIKQPRGLVSFKLLQSLTK
jgi:hypothetical protein